jgi:hypothetical protein
MQDFLNNLKIKILTLEVDQESQVLPGLQDDQVFHFFQGGQVHLGHQGGSILKIF